MPKTIVTKNVYPHLGIIDEVEEIVEEERVETEKYRHAKKERIPMITYNVLKQNIGVLADFEPVIIREHLHLRFENIEHLRKPITAKIVGNAPHFCSLENGDAVFPKTALVGKIGVCLITSDGTIPCAGFRAVTDKDGRLWLYPDLSDVLKRLSAAEKEISDLIIRYSDLAEKYKTLEDKLAKLFSGYNY